MLLGLQIVKLALSAGTKLRVGMGSILVRRTAQKRLGTCTIRAEFVSEHIVPTTVSIITCVVQEFLSSRTGE